MFSIVDNDPLRSSNGVQRAILLCFLWITWISFWFSVCARCLHNHLKVYLLLYILYFLGSLFLVSLYQFNLENRWRWLPHIFFHVFDIWADLARVYVVRQPAITARSPPVYHTSPEGHEIPKLDGCCNDSLLSYLYLYGISKALNTHRYLILYIPESPKSISPVYIITTSNILFTIHVLGRTLGFPFQIPISYSTV